MRLLVETDDFAFAAWAMCDGAGDPLADALFRLHVALSGCGGMAGSDPTGASWARSYDPAAEQALTGLRALVNGCYRLASMFSQTCRNYATAEQASTADRWAAESAHLDVAQLPGDCSVSWDVQVPSALGDSSGGPPGWSLVMSAVGRVWPGGHQDRLRAAAVAWRTAAGAVDAAGAGVRSVPGGLAADPVVESDDIAAVCLAVVDAASRLATAMDALAESCEELAGRLDALHRDVEHELASLAAQSVAIEGIGAAVGFFTLGAAEAPAQALESWRVEAIAGRVLALIDTFAAVAEELAAAVARVVELAGTVSRGLEELFAPRLAIAAVTPVRTLPAELSTVDGITSTEMAAADNLGATAGASELSRITEDVDLAAEEARGGHAISAHIEMTIDQLRARDLPMASTFRDLDAATAATEGNLRLNVEKIRGWLASGRRKLTIYAPLDGDAGVIFLRDTGELVRPTRVCTVLRRDGKTGEWFVRTSFPDIEGGR